MKYYKDGNEFSLTEIKKIHSNVSFRDPQQLGYSVIFDTPKPTCGELEQAIHNGVTTDANGNIVRAWLVRDMFSDYTNEDGVLVTKAEQETAYLATKAQQAQDVINREARQYLADTDWYAVRLAETGIAIPADIVTARAEARAKVV